MNKYEAVKNSILKNLGEFSEFVVDLGITNFYDLVDYIIDLHNFRVKVYKENKSLATKIMKEIEKEG